MFTLTVRYLIISCHQKIFITALATENSLKIGQFSHLLARSKYMSRLRENPQEPELYFSILIDSGLHTAGKINRHTRYSLTVRIRLACLFCFGGDGGFLFEPAQLKAAHTSETGFFRSVKHMGDAVSDAKEKEFLCSYCSLFVIPSRNTIKDFRSQADPLILHCYVLPNKFIFLFPSWPFFSDNNR